MKKKIIGTLFQVIAVCVLLTDIFFMYPTAMVLLGGEPSFVAKSIYNPLESFFPFALWFLGAGLKRHSPMASRITIFGMAYLILIAALNLFKALKLSQMGMPSEVALPLYGIITIAFIIPAVCIWAIFPIPKDD